MRREVLVVAWMVLGMVGAKKVTALPQAVGTQEGPTEPKKSDSLSQQGQQQDSGGESWHDGENSVSTIYRGGRLAERFLLDQKEIWTSPAQLRIPDAGWLMPLGGFTSMLFVTDAQFSRHLSNNPTTISHYKTLSDAGVAALVGGAAGLWALSFPKNNSHWRETGFLSGEAAINSLVVIEALKYSMRRERPYQGNGNGDFFQQGGTSFPSEHAAAAFAVAGIIAHEYPGPLPKILAYGLATTVALSRVKAKQHFNSDVLVGSVMGDMISQSVYSRHFDPELGGAAWTSTSQYFHDHWKPEPESMGSPNVPLDSWVYPAIERLAAQGLVQSQFLNVRPWTRLECVTLLNEAASKLDDATPRGVEMAGIVAALRKEFAAELQAFETGVENSFQMESVYTRFTDISGPPLADSYHFGQTIYNDNGRPYEEGINNITGFSTYATANRFAVYFSGEFQHAPSAPAYSLPVRQAIAQMDQNPLQPASPIEEVNRFTIQNAYLNTNINSWNFSFGKQDMWWSPSYGSSFLFSDNAEPIYMFQVSRITPFTLPWILRYLGPTKVDFFVGRMRGNNFPQWPIFHGEKITFKPTENLELGFSRTTEFGGTGRPLTLGAIWNSYVSFTSSGNYAPNRSPGHRVGGFDFSYRLPFVRNWLTLYADAMTSDDPSPIDAPRRASVNPGLYLARVPGIPKLDFRVEGIYTDSATSRSNGGKFSYWELFLYHDAYTNQGFLMGSWIGREAVGGQAWTTYWFSPRSSLQFGYRYQRVSSDFVPHGETLHDGSVKLDAWIRNDLSVSALVQYEQWKAPLLAPTRQTNWTSSLGVVFWPSWRTK